METLRESIDFYVPGKNIVQIQKNKLALFINFIKKTVHHLASRDSSPDGAGAPQGLLACGGLAEI